MSKNKLSAAKEFVSILTSVEIQGEGLSHLLLALKVRFETHIKKDGKKTYIEDLLKEEKDFLSLLASNGDELNDSNLLVSDANVQKGHETLNNMIKASLSTLLKDASGEKPQITQPKPLLGTVVEAFSKVVSLAVGQPPEELFFQCLHIYGLANEFESEDYFRQMPIEFRTKYITWKKENKKVVDSFAELNNQQETSDPRSGNEWDKIAKEHPNHHVREFYRLLAGCT